MAKIINFPNSPKSAAQIEAEAMELNKMATEVSLRVAMTSPIWEYYELTTEDIDTTFEWLLFINLISSPNVVTTISRGLFSPSSV